MADTHSSSAVTAPSPATQHSRQAFAARRFRHRNDLVRERDVLRHVQTWERMYNPTQLHRNPFAPDGNPAPCPDTALAAFAQLAALRMHSRRCLISLTCQKTEWILVDAGANTALQYSAGNDRDRPWIGTCSFPREEFFGHLALDEWCRARRAREPPEDNDHYYTGGVSQHAFIISDVRHDDRYQSLDLAHRGPWIRFHCSVPLRDAMGSVLGSLTVLDDRPRYGISVDELTLLEDLSDTIAEHLSATLARVRWQRGERLISSLGLFHAGEDSLREWWLGQDDARVLNTGRNVDKGTTTDRQGRVDAEFGTHTQSQIGDENAETLVSGERVQRDYFGNLPEHDSNANRVQENAGVSPQSLDRLTPAADAQNKEMRGRRRTGATSDLARSTASMYRRASNILREALGADGVAFVAAGNVSTSSSQSTDESGGDMISTSDAESSDSGSDGTPMCKVQATSIRNVSAPTDNDNLLTRVRISEHYLQHLIKRCSSGFVCHFDQQGRVYRASDESSSQSSSEEFAPKQSKRKVNVRLGKVFPGVRTLSVYPLWDDGYSRWRSCIFVWTTSVERSLDQGEDLTFLKTFGNTIIAELSRLESVAADTSKATFISSISHELRSPLHGILAGAEFLHETPLSEFQLEMTHAISMAGKTLLDTVNHVLDYSKIKGSFGKQTQPPTPSSIEKSRQVDATLRTDLARLTEEVVETAVTARRLDNGGLPSPGSAGGPRSPAHRSSISSASAMSGVSLTLTIEQRKNWMVATHAGAWTRILANLVGNAIKYTPDGHISITLSVDDPLASDPRRCPVQLRVEDSGIGMSESFIAHGLYTPFKQENPYADGTGLGLSIVKQIVDSMDAELTITSKLGKGTVAQVKFIAQFVQDDVAADEAPASDTPLEKTKSPTFERLRMLPGPTSAMDGRLTPSDEAHSLLINSICDNAKQWFGCEVVEHADEEDDKTLWGITEQNLIAWSLQDPKEMSRMLGDVSRLFVFATSMQSVALPLTPHNLPPMPIFIHQPIGPQKMLRAMTCNTVATARDDQSIASAPHKKRRITATDTATSTATTAEIRPSDEPASPINSQERRDSILLVEDNEVNMKFLVTLVTKLKVPHQCAVNGLEALQIYSRNPRSFFLVLMDMSMPVMDGFTSTLKIREEETKRKLERCFIAALTGVTDAAERQRAFDSGIDEFHNKPIKMKALKDFIEVHRQQ